MILELFELKGKNALVTGSSRGLGTAIAIALAEAGANVGCHGRSAEVLVSLCIRPLAPVGGKGCLRPIRTRRRQVQ